MWFFILFFFNSEKKKKKNPSIQDLVDPKIEKVGVEVDNDRVVVDNVEGGGVVGDGGERSRHVHQTV